MKSNRKDEILDAATSIIEEGGLSALTYESLSSRTGISKSGLIYHFPTMHSVRLALHQKLALQWTKQLEAIAGSTPEDLDSTSKVRSYLKSQVEAATKAELLLSIDANSDPDFSKPWAKVNESWSPTTGTDEQNRLYLIKLIADGLWIHDHINNAKLGKEERRKLATLSLKFLLEDE